MNKEKQFQHYRPFLKYLFGTLPDKEYGALFWPGSDSSKRNFSQFLTHGEKAAEVRRRIAGLLASEPGLLARIRSDAEVLGLQKEVDAVFDDHQINVDALASLSLDKVCELFEPVWQKGNVIDALRHSLEVILKLSKSHAEARDSKTSALWLGISVLLQRPTEVPGRLFLNLEEIFNKAISACSDLADKTCMIEAEFMFRNRVLTSKNNFGKKISPTKCMANSR